MNSFHKLLNDLHAGFIYTFNSAAESLFLSLSNNISNEKILEMQKAVVFDLKELDNFPVVDFTKFGFIGLPYEKVWVEAGLEHDANNRMGAFIERRKENVCGVEIEFHDWLLFIWSSAKKHWSFNNALTTWNSQRGMEVSVAILHDGIPGDIYGEWAGCVYAAFLAARCKNVEKVENKPSALKLKRSKEKGQFPVFSDWTLHIIPSEKEQGEHTGGSHASPRTHLRRGHIREYRPGLFTWVQDTIVGAGPIEVRKDYEVRSNK